MFVLNSNKLVFYLSSEFAFGSLRDMLFSLILFIFFLGGGGVSPNVFQIRFTFPFPIFS